MCFRQKGESSLLLNVTLIQKSKQELCSLTESSVKFCDSIVYGDFILSISPNQKAKSKWVIFLAKSAIKYLSNYYQLKQTVSALDSVASYLTCKQPP